MDVKKLMKQASKFKKVQKELKKATVEEEIDGIRLVISGTGKVKDFEIPEEKMGSPKKYLETTIRAVIESCLKKQSDMQQQKAKEAMGGMGGLSGMMG